MTPRWLNKLHLNVTGCLQTTAKDLPLQEVLKLAFCYYFVIVIPSIHFHTTYPTEGQRESGVYPRGRHMTPFTQYGQFTPEARKKSILLI